MASIHQPYLFRWNDVDAQSDLTRLKLVLEKLEQHQDLLQGIFDDLVRQLGAMLPDLGTHLAGDTKAIGSHAAGRSHRETKDLVKNGRGRDRRCDVDANWGMKGKTQVVDGEKRKKGMWFGYKLGLVVDARYDLPLAWSLDKASTSDYVTILPLLNDLKDGAPVVAARGRDIALDKGYDSAELNAKLFDNYDLKPIIARRNAWASPDETRIIDPARITNIEYDESGRLFCTCPQTHLRRKMVFRGFEKDRRSLKFQCPAAYYGEHCKGRFYCCSERKKTGKIIRVPLSVDRRVFTPMARDTQTWARLYRGRSSVETVNARVDRSLGMERHFIRFLAKMRAHLVVGLSAMLSMALAWIRRGQKANRGCFQRLPKAA